MISDMRVAVLVVDGMFDTGLSAVLDTLAMANELGTQLEVGSLFSVTIVAVRKRVTTQQGFRIPALHVSEIAKPDLTVVPALGAKSPSALAEALERRDVRDACRQLVRWHAGGGDAAAACTGTYVLAASGLLDGLRATTSWWLAPDFRQRFPAVQLRETHMVIAEPRCVTAGAALAHVDLALWLVRQKSPALARTTSRYLLIDGRPSQASYAMTDHLAHADPMVEKFERWARAHLAEFSMGRAARAVGASERTLERRLQKVLGRTPIAYVRDLRIEQAIHRLETTTDSVERIAEAVGYGDGVTLRTLLRKRTGRGIRDLRHGGHVGTEAVLAPRS